MAKNRTCYLMVKDIDGQDCDAALEWGVDYGLEEGEELPEDVEQLTEAQYTVFRIMKILKGTFEGQKAEQIMGEKGSGLVVPQGRKA